MPEQLLTESRSSLVEAITTFLPTFAPATVFDVGANVGQSTIAFTAAFPKAAIYAFEPVSETFKRLVEVTRALPAVRTSKLALGRIAGQVLMITNAKHSTAARVAIDRPKDTDTTEVVPMDTGDAICSQNSIDHIGFLKIDTEGHDLNVLVGFSNMLKEMRIDLVEAEVSMNRRNNKHVPFEVVRLFLEAMGYSLFHIYEQTLDSAFSGRPTLRRSNVVFISAAMVEAHKRRK